MADEPNTPPAPPTPDEIFAMTPEAAREQLAAMQAAHVAALAATAEKPAEPVAVTDADGKPLVKPPEQAFTPPEQRRAEQAEDLHRHLEAMGLPDRSTQAGKEIWEMLEGTRPVNDAAMPQRFERAQTILAQMKSDRGFAAKLFAGDREAAQDFHVVCAVIAAGQKEGF